MSLCQAKRGFFTLYDCPKESKKQCTTCQRNLCEEHFPNTFSKCVECSAKVKDTSDNVVIRSYQVRHQNLLRKSTSNIYFGDSLTEYYDQYDLRAFDLELGSLSEMVDSPDEIFFDS